jgi:hypothetical protein
MINFITCINRIIKYFFFIAFNLWLLQKNNTSIISTNEKININYMKGVIIIESQRSLTPIYFTIFFVYHIHHWWQFEKISDQSKTKNWSSFRMSLIIIFCHTEYWIYRCISSSKHETFEPQIFCNRHVWDFRKY